jgi:DNA-binding MarR family transcriptional regulator
MSILMYIYYIFVVMKNKTVEIVNHWHTFETSHPEAEIGDFCRYFLAKNKNQTGQEDPNEGIPLNGRLGRTIGRLGRFAQFYSRRVLADLELNNLDDFTYLQVLHKLKNPKKSVLIEENISEFSTGSEIIKRLSRQGFIKEYPDKEDGRSKRLALTAKGKKTLDGCYERMQNLTAMLFINMPDDDKELIYLILSPLDQVHTQAYRQVKTKDLEKIKEALESYQR